LFERGLPQESDKKRGRNFSGKPTKKFTVASLLKLNRNNKNKQHPAFFFFKIKSKINNLFSKQKEKKLLKNARRS